MRTLAAAILASLALLASRATSEEKNVLVYRLELPRKRFLAGENVLLRLALENKGTTAVSVPDPEVNVNTQPTYTLLSPGDPGGETFTLRDRIEGGGRRVAVAPVLREILPGASWEGHLSLSQVAALGSSGDYRVRSRLEWSGGAVDSNEVAFAIDPLRLADVGFGPSATRDGFSELFACAHARAGDSSAVLLMRFMGVGHPGEPLTAESIATIATAPASARDPATPASRHLRIPDLFNWSLWREGRELLALTTWGGDPCRFELPGEGVLLRPPLMTPTHELDAFAISGAYLLRVRFDDPDRRADRRGRLLNAHELPIQPASGGCALDADAARRHVALLGAAEGKLVLLHAAYTDKAVPRIERLDLDGLEPIADAPPAIAASSTETRVLLVARASGGDEPRDAVLVEATFPVDTTKGASATRRTFKLPERADAARVGFAPLGMRSDAFVRTVDGRLHVLGDTARVVRARLDPLVPLVVVVLDAASYLLEKDARRGLILSGL